MAELRVYLQEVTYVTKEVTIEVPDNYEFTKIQVLVDKIAVENTRNGYGADVVIDDLIGEVTSKVVNVRDIESDVSVEMLEILEEGE